MSFSGMKESLPWFFRWGCPVKGVHASFSLAFMTIEIISLSSPTEFCEGRDCFNHGFINSTGQTVGLKDLRNQLRM